MNLDEILHTLVKRIKPNYPFVDDEQWYQTFGDDSGSGYHKCLICETKIHFIADYHYDEVLNTWNSPETLQGHRLKHIKEYNLTAFL